MSILDNLRDKILSFTDAEYVNEYEDSEADATGSMGTGLLGNTSRPEVDSVSVFTRGGKPIEGDVARVTQMPTSSGYPSEAAERSYKARLVEGAGETRLRHGGMNTSGQLPPYVFRPQNYEDVQTVFRRVKTNQPVVLNFVKTDAMTSRRILDFCFGFMSGVGGAVDQLSQDVFVLLPPGIVLMDSDVDKLQREGLA